MKNVRHQPNNPTETQAISARTQIAKQYSELGSIDLHRIPESYIPVNRGSLHFPAAADNPGWMRWSPEDGEGGLRRVLLPRPLVPPQGANKIYRSDEVFLIEKAKRNDQIITQFPYKSTRMTWYSPLVKPERKSKANRSIPYK